MRLLKERFLNLARIIYANDTEGFHLEFKWSDKPHHADSNRSTELLTRLIVYRSEVDTQNLDKVAYSTLALPKNTVLVQLSDEEWNQYVGEKDAL